MEERKRRLHGDGLRNNKVYQGYSLSLETMHKTLQDTSKDDDPQILGPWFLAGPSHSEASPANPVENTLLDTVTLSSGTLAQSPVARQPFIGKLMSVAPLAGSLWMLSTKGAGEEGQHKQSITHLEWQSAGTQAAGLGARGWYKFPGARCGQGQGSHKSLEARGG